MTWLKIRYRSPGFSLFVGIQAKPVSYRTRSFHLPQSYTECNSADQAILTRFLVKAGHGIGLEVTYSVVLIP